MSLAQGQIQKNEPRQSSEAPACLVGTEIWEQLPSLKGRKLRNVVLCKPKEERVLRMQSKALSGTTKKSEQRDKNKEMTAGIWQHGCPW